MFFLRTKRAHMKVEDIKLFIRKNFKPFILHVSLNAIPSELTSLACTNRHF